MAEVQLDDLFRRSTRLVYGVYLLYGAFIITISATVSYYVGVIASVLTVVALVLAVQTPLYRPRGTETVRYVTEKSPADVRDEFASPRPPVLALRMAGADEITELSNGSQFTIDYVLGSNRMQYEYTEGSDDQLSAEVYEDGDLQASFTVTLAEHDETTEVILEAEPSQRYSILGLLVLLAAKRTTERAMRRQGYEPTSQPLFGV